jgi:hypothetical protein
MLRSSVLVVACALGLPALLAPAIAAPRVLMVGPGARFASPCRAIAAAAPGDTILIDARGSRMYRGDVCAWRTGGLTIVGIHGRAHVDAAGRNSEGKATWVIAGNHTTIENVEFSGARVPDANGAGIRQEGAGLTLVHCYFHDNQEGILAADNPASNIVIDSSIFKDNGAGDGYSHNIYINHVRSFTFRYSYSTGARRGHLLKSRALRNYIISSRLSGERGADAYELDLPNGGLSYVIGTVIQKGSRTRRQRLLAYGEEGNLNPDSQLYAVNDTFVNDLGHGTAMFIAPGVKAAAVAENDISTGSSTFLNEPNAARRHDCLTSHPGFRDPRRYDYMLRAGSPCQVGRRAESAHGYPLAPRSQFVYPAGHRRRYDGGTSAGAFGQVER